MSLAGAQEMLGGLSARPGSNASRRLPLPLCGSQARLIDDARMMSAPTGPVGLGRSATADRITGVI